MKMIFGFNSNMRDFSDFCYKCGALNHVIGRCTFEIPLTITSPNDIVAKLYGSWLWAEHGMSLLLINLALEFTRKALPFLGSNSNEIARTYIKNFLINSLTSHLTELDKTITSIVDLKKNDSLKIFQNEISKSFETDTKDFTLQRQKWNREILQEAVIERLRKKSFNPGELAFWAISMVQKIIV